jgi:adenylyltransferase/sulfurtransferase
VFVAGAGGLGCAVCLYLAAAGVGTLRIADHGDVETSNLNRQILYTPADVGKAKTAVMSERLTALNPGVRVDARRVTMDPSSLPGLLQGCALAVDALDSLPARYALNKAAMDARIPLLHGAVHGFGGQALTVIPGETACLMCLYQGAAPAVGAIPVIGTAPGTIGLVEAAEAVKLLTGKGRSLAGRLLLYDGLDMSFTELAIARDPSCPHCGRG